MFGLSNIDKLIRQQKKYYSIERVFCSISGGLLSGVGILTFLFLDQIAGVLLFVAGVTLFFWARRQKKLTQRLLPLLRTLRKLQD